MMYVCYIQHPKRVIRRKERLAFFLFSDPFDFHCTTTTTTTAAVVAVVVVVIASFFFARPCQLIPRGCPMEISDLTRANKKTTTYIILIFTNTNHIYSESQWDVFYSDILL